MFGVLSLLYVLPLVASQPLPVAYGDFVLDILDERWLYQDRVAWAQFRSDIEVWGESAQGVEELNADLMKAFEAAGDRHSKILSLEVAAERGSADRWGLGLGLTEGGIVRNVYAGGPADLAGLRVGEKVISVDGVPLVTGAGRERLANPGDGVAELVVESVAGEQRKVRLSADKVHSYLAPSSRSITSEIALLELPVHSGSGSIPGVGDYSELVRDALSMHEGSCGFLVDLRRNSGGNMWPVLEGVLPLLPSGPAGSFQSSSGSLQGWLSGLGKMSVPVAVLTSSSTASSGEALVVAFRGRPRTRFFGEATFGVPTSIRPHPLPGGYWLYLAEGAFVDRVGQSYSGPIAPDEVIPVDWARFGTENDPVLAAGVQWLSRQEGCQR